MKLAVLKPLRRLEIEVRQRLVPLIGHDVLLLGHWLVHRLLQTVIVDVHGVVNLEKWLCNLLVAHRLHVQRRRGQVLLLHRGRLHRIAREYHLLLVNLLLNPVLRFAFLFFLTEHVWLLLGRLLFCRVV